MQIFKGRPLASAVFFALLTVAFSALLSPEMGIYVSFVSAAAFFLVIASRRRNPNYERQIMTATVAALLITACGLRSYFYFNKTIDESKLSGEDKVSVIAEVLELKSASNYSS